MCWNVCVYFLLLVEEKKEEGGKKNVISYIISCIKTCDEYFTYMIKSDDFFCVCLLTALLKWMIFCSTDIHVIHRVLTVCFFF